MKISIDSDGKVEVSWEGAVQTPIGTFSVEAGVDVGSLVPKEHNTLTVSVDGENTIYDLQGEKDIRVELDSGYYKQVVLRKEKNNWFFEVESLLVASCEEQELVQSDEELPQ